MWILTVTTCPPECENSDSLCAQVLAAGKSSDDHAPIIAKHLAQANELMSGFPCYFGETNEIGRMAVGMIAWLADRPKRQAVTFARKEGHWGLVLGFATGILEELLPASLQIRNVVALTVAEDGPISIKTWLQHYTFDIRSEF